MTDGSTLERLLRHDRLIVTAGLAGVVALAWLYLLRGAGLDMHEMGGMLMPTGPETWSLGYAALLLLMWSVMMLAMMLPGAAPMLLLHARVARQGGGGAATTGLFALGYVVVWTLFSLAATALQWGLEGALLLSPMMQTTSVALAGLLLIAAGLYQWTPLKQACLSRCRSPLDFLLTAWRPGAGGALVMGLKHGAYCLGCCWALMLLLFVGGIMNLLWIAGLALFVLAEKALPAGHWLSRVAGIALIVWGGATLVSLI